MHYETYFLVKLNETNWMLQMFDDFSYKIGKTSNYFIYLGWIDLQFGIDGVILTIALILNNG